MPTDGLAARSSAHLRDLYAAGQPAFGLWSIRADPIVAELLAGMPFDYTSGASGVVVPMVNDAEEAHRAASACRYPPIGIRSWGPRWGT